MKILFIENVPWLQRVEYKLVDSREMTQRDEYKGLELLKEEITRENFLEHSMLGSWVLELLNSLNSAWWRGLQLYL